jgi:outer membrane murein-binding lipoprotein Lpp
MTVDWIDIVVTILTTGVFSLIGFVWRFSHKVTQMEQQVNELTSRVRKMERDHDKVMDRVYSLAKSRSEFMTKESYHRNKDIDRYMIDKKEN